MRTKNIQWRQTARESQILPNTDWKQCLVLSCRGWGYTRMGSEWILDEMIKFNNSTSIVVNLDESSLRYINVEGVSGILECAKNRCIDLKYNLSRGTIDFINGSRIKFMSLNNYSSISKVDCLFWDNSFNGISNDDDNIFNMEYRKKALDYFSEKSNKMLWGGVPVPVEPYKNYYKKYKDNKNEQYIFRKGATFENSSLSPELLRAIEEKYKNTKIGINTYKNIFDEECGEADTHVSFIKPKKPWNDL